ncbi:putative ribonuclease H-like domain-containing protein [Tanacetum coccineum]
MDDLERLKKQEKEAYDEAEALRKKFETLVIKEGAAKPSSLNIFSTVSTPAKASSTNIVNAVSLPVSTASPIKGLTLADPTHSEEDDSEIPPLEDIYQNTTDGIFTTSSFDDEGSRVVVRNKARLVAQGHRQEEGIDYDEVFAPVARLEAIRIIFSLAIIYGLIVYQIDLKSAFLYGKIDEEVPKGQTPNWGLWYPRVSSFDLESYSDSDYAGANLDRKSTTGGCQFLGRRLISWQCKKQTIVATSTTEAEYVAAASCCGQVLWIQNQMLDYGFNFMNIKIYIDNESTICIVKNPVYHSKTKHIAIRHHFIRDAYEKKLIQVLKIHTDDNVADLLTKAFDVSSTMAVLDSCLKHNMVAYLEKSEGNEEFHEIIDFLKRSSIHHALTASIRSDLLFDDADGIDSLPNQTIFDAIQQMGKVTPLFATMLVQPTQDEGASSERPSEALPTPSPAPTSEVPHEPQTDSSPAQTKPSGENLGGHSSSDRSLSRNEGDMTLQSVYDLCLSLCAQVSDQAKEIQALKAQITKLKKQAKPVIKHHQAYLKSVSLKQRFPRKSFLKKHRVHKESVSKQGRKFAKGESSVQRDPMFDEIPKDTVDHMDTENARDEGRTREIVDEDKEIEENKLNTEDVLSTDKEGVSTDMEKVSTDRPIVSTDGSKLVLTSKMKQNEGTEEKKESTEEHIEGTDEQNEGTEEKKESTEEHIEGTKEQVESTDGHKKAKVLLNMSQAKAVSREKEKGVRVKMLKKLIDLDPIHYKITFSHLKPLPKIDPKRTRKEENERRINQKIDFLLRSFKNIEERAKFLHDTIAAQRKFLAQQRSEAIRNRPPIKNQLRNQMMTYLKHVGNFKHAELKIKKFEEVQALYEKIKRSDEDFISIGSAEDERPIKRMNEKGVDSSKDEMIKEESKEEVKKESKAEVQNG